MRNSIRYGVLAGIITPLLLVGAMVVAVELTRGTSAAGEKAVSETSKSCSASKLTGGGCPFAAKAGKVALGGEGSSQPAQQSSCGAGGCPHAAKTTKAAQGGDGTKAACPACTAGGKKCEKCEKAALGGGGSKDEMKASCPGCAAAGKMCEKCEKAALGGEGSKGEPKAGGCPVCASGRACAACSLKKAEKVAKGGEGTKDAFLGNPKCPIMGGKADPKQFVAYDDPKTHTHANVYVCCPGCIDKVKADPAAAYMKAYLNSEVKDGKGKVIAKKGEAIALNNATCPIMGGKVSPTNYLTYNGYKIGLCCPACENEFMKAPDKHLALLVKAGKEKEAK